MHLIFVEYKAQARGVVPASMSQRQALKAGMGSPVHNLAWARAATNTQERTQLSKHKDTIKYMQLANLS